MNEHPLRAADYIGHMLEAIDRIQCYTKEMTEAEFENHSMAQDAVLRNLGNMGEASKNFLSKATDEMRKSSSIPFAKIYGMRNQIFHSYFMVDMALFGM